jgi:signal transduction histidine kinase
MAEEQVAVGIRPFAEASPGRLASVLLCWISPPPLQVFLVPPCVLVYVCTAIVAHVISDRPRSFRVSSRCIHTRLAALLLVLCMPCVTPGAEIGASASSRFSVTNIAQLRKLVRDEWRIRCDLQLTGVICTVSEQLQALVLADETGAELLTMDFRGLKLEPGRRVSLAGVKCEVTRRREGLVLGRAPVLENDGLHKPTEKTTSVELAAGWHPIRVEWFNGALGAVLEVDHAAPGDDWGPISPALLARIPEANAGGEPGKPGLEFANYEGGWAALPDFGRWPLIATGVVPSFDVSVRSRPANVGLVFRGWFHATQAGTHQFRLRSDDGSRMIIGEPLPRITVLEKASLPQVRRYFIGQAVGDKDYYVWASADGDVGWVEMRDGRMEMEVLSRREGRLLVEILDPGGMPPALLLKNKVRVNGVSRAVLTPGGPQIFGYLSSIGDGAIQLLEAAPEVLAAYPVTMIGDLPAAADFEREGCVFRLRGRLEAAHEGAALVLSDPTGSVLIAPQASPARSQVGAELESLAFCRPVGGEWVLEAGFFRPGRSVEQGEANPPPLLTTAEEILRLQPAEAAREHPARLRGVITCLWPDYSDNAILQDATRGVFVKLPGAAARRGLEVGDSWEVEGVTAPGDFAPILKVSRLTRLAEGRLPEPVRPTWDQLINGSLDAQYVELEGIITEVNGDLSTLLTHWGKIDVSVSGRSPMMLEQYENHLVRLRGCLLAAWDQASGLVRLGELRLASATISAEESVSPDPFSAPLKTLRSLLRFDVRSSVFQRVRIAGQIVSRRGDEFFLTTDEGGCRFVSRISDHVGPGDLVEVAGFPQLEGPSPVLREAVVHKKGSAALPPPRWLGPGNVLNADNDALRVSCEATLISERGGPGGIAILELQAGLRAFVMRTTFPSEKLPKLRPGSRLEVTGVFAGQGNSRLAERKLDTFELLVDSPSGVRVIALPPWWTLRRLLVALGVLLVVLAGAMLWGFQLRRRVEAQTVIIRRKVEREATLEERTRIARELHDTLEQALAGVSFQLGALAGSIRSMSAEAREILERARQMVRHGQEEARRSVRNLRMFELEGGDLPGALQQMAQDAAQSLPVKIEAVVHGQRESLSGQTENHLLRIAQEAMTNAVKHGHASAIRFDLRYEAEQVELQVTDNGCGFDASGTGPTERGHFGLLGMRERSNKIRGRFKITSQPGEGTTVLVQVPYNGHNSLKGPA